MRWAREDVDVAVTVAELLRREGRAAPAAHRWAGVEVSWVRSAVATGALLVTGAVAGTAVLPTSPDGPRAPQARPPATAGDGLLAEGGREGVVDAAARSAVPEPTAPDPGSAAPSHWSELAFPPGPARRTAPAGADRVTTGSDQGDADGSVDASSDEEQDPDPDDSRSDDAEDAGDGGTAGDSDRSDRRAAVDVTASIRDLASVKLHGDLPARLRSLRARLGPVAHPSHRVGRVGHRSDRAAPARARVVVQTSRRSDAQRDSS